MRIPSSPRVAHPVRLRLRATLPATRPAALLAACLLAAPSAAQSTLLEIVGDATGEYASAVAVVGDLDGDGLDDLAIGAPKAPGGGDRRGRVEVWSARPPALLFVHEGGADFDELGFAVAGVGDVDGDGIADYAAGTFGGNYARVWSGADGSEIHTFTTGTSGDFFGYAVAGAGDVDGDGRADVLVGTNRILVLAPGFARLFSGADGSVVHTFTGDAAFDGFGNAVAGGEDVDGDGVPDVAVGGPGIDAAGTDAGRVRVYSGSTGALLHTFDGDAASDELGTSVALVPDANGDGRAEIAVGAPGCGVQLACPTKEGWVRVLDGASGAELFTLFGDSPLSMYGFALAAAADVDGDGRGDLAIGVPGAEARSGVNAGRVDVVSGLDGALLMRLAGAERAAGAGVAVASGDLNGDGTSDVLAGSAAGRARGASIRLGRSVDTVALSSGGAQELSIVAGEAHAGAPFALLGTSHGTEPGLAVAGVLLPLELGSIGPVDGAALTKLAFLSLRKGSSAPLQALVAPGAGAQPLLVRVGRLDARGEARATLAIPPGAYPALAGTTVHHAYLVLDEVTKTAVLASNPVALELLP